MSLCSAKGDFIFRVLGLRVRSESGMPSEETKEVRVSCRLGLPVPGAPRSSRGGGAQQVVAAALSSCCQELWGQSPCPSPRAGGASYGRAFPLSPGESAGRRCAGACGQGCCGDTGKYPAWPVPPDAHNWALEDGIMRTSSQPSPPPPECASVALWPTQGAN